jgi:hypothetical protein
MKVRNVAYWMLLALGCHNPTKSNSDMGTNGSPDLASGGSGLVQVGTTFGQLSAALAQFPSVSASCMPTPSGPCTVSVCRTDVTQVSAGAITLSSGTSTQTLNFVGGAYEGFDNPMSEIWPPATKVDISAAGATVPMFAGTVTIPSRLTITAPALPAGGAPISIDRANDLALTWTNGNGNENLNFLLVQDATGGGVQILDCRLPANSNSGSIPKASFATFNAGNATFGVYNISEITTPGAWAITLRANSAALDGNGIRFEGPAMVN